MEFRQVFANEVMKLMEQDDKIVVLDADLAKPDGLAPIQKQYPNRFIECGIAEANMVGIAAGLSAYGYKPIIVSFAPFVTRRVFDQIAVSVAYAKQNVKIIGTDPGVFAELNGGTHMTFADVALMRSVPNMKVIDVVDAYQLEKATQSLINYPGNVYIRLPRKTHPDVFNEDYKYNPDKIDVIKNGKDVSLIASGALAYETIEAAKELESIGINAEVLAVNSIKPLDEQVIIDSVKKTGIAITIENHSVYGGLYSAVCEVVCSNYPVKVKSMGIKDEFGQVGKVNELLQAYNLTKDDIVKFVKNELNK